MAFNVFEMRSVLQQLNLSQVELATLVKAVVRQQAQFHAMEKQELLLRFKQQEEQIKEQTRLEFERRFNQMKQQQQELIEKSVSEQNLKLVEMFDKQARLLQENFNQQKHDFAEQLEHHNHIRDILKINCQNWSTRSGLFRFQVIGNWVSIFTTGIPFSFQNMTNSRALEIFCQEFAHSSNYVNPIIDTDNKKLFIEVITNTKESAQLLLDRYISNKILSNINRNLSGIKFDAIELVEVGMVEKNYDLNVHGKQQKETQNVSTHDEKVIVNLPSLQSNSKDSLSKELSNNSSVTPCNTSFRQTGVVTTPQPQHTIPLTADLPTNESSKSLPSASVEEFHPSSSSETTLASAQPIATSSSRPTLSAAAPHLTPMITSNTVNAASDSNRNPFFDLFEPPGNNQANTSQPLSFVHSTTPSLPPQVESVHFQSKLSPVKIDSSPSVDSPRNFNQLETENNKQRGKQESAELERNSQIKPPMLNKSSSVSSISVPSLIQSSFTGKKLHINVLFLRVQLKQKAFSCVRELQAYLLKSQSFSVNDCWVERIVR